MNRHVLKRSELYGLVWNQPVRTVAADIGISDVALAKACRKHGIPVPGRGYWRRKELGYKVKRPPLAPLPSGVDLTITFRATRRFTETATVLSPEEMLEQQLQNRIVVPGELTKRHKFVRRTLTSLRQQARGPRPLIMTRGVDRFRVTVARASLERVERLLQTLVDAWTARGYVLVKGELGKSLLTVRVHDEAIEVAISERTKRLLVTTSGRPQYETVPIGILAIRVANSPGNPQQVTVRDRSGAPLEERLNEVMVRMAEAARLIREAREARERQRKEWEEDERRSREARERVELQRARLRRVQELVELWQAHDALRGFLAVVRKRMEVARPELVPAARAWVDWAEEYLEDNHPADPLFFEPLIQPGTSGFWRYSSPSGSNRF